MKKWVTSLILAMAFVLTLPITASAMGGSKQNVNAKYDAVKSLMGSQVHSKKSADELYGYYDHFMRRSNWRPGQVFPYSNSGGWAGTINDGTYTINVGSCKGCYAYSKFISMAIYGTNGNRTGNAVKDGNGYNTGSGIRDLILEKAQFGEHIRIDETHSITYLASDDGGFYGLEYWSSGIAFVYYSYDALASQAGSKNVWIYDADTVDNIQKPIPIITDVKVETIVCRTLCEDYGYQYAYQVSCKIENDSDLTKVQFPTWTDYNGQDDLVWHDGIKLSDGRYFFRIMKSQHNNETGLYYTHIYAWNSQGKSSVYGLSARILSHEESDAVKPNVSDVKLEKVDVDGFEVSCKIDCEYGVLSSTAIFTHEGRTYPIRISGVEENGRYWFRVKVDNYDNLRGEYKMTRITATDKTFFHDAEIISNLTITVPEPVINVTGVSLDKTTLAMVKDQQETLVATVAPDNATNSNVVWKSSNESVATVENGTVTAVSVGTATIKAISEENEELFGECAVTVTEPAPAEEPGSGENGNGESGSGNTGNGNTGSGNTGNGSTTDNSQTQDPTQAEKVNTTEPAHVVWDVVTDENYDAIYIITGCTSGRYTVTYAKPVMSSETEQTVPSTVTIDGQSYKVTEIRSNAFKGCKSLKSITIGSNIKKIGSKAFFKCKNLKNVTIKSTLLTTKSVGSNAFNGINEKAKVKVPKKKLSSYRKILKARGIDGKNQKITK